MDTRTALAILGLPLGSTADAIRDAYRDLAKVWHPDRFAGDVRLQAKASDKMRELNEAYRIATASGPAASTSMGASPTPASGGAAPPPPVRPVNKGSSWPAPFVSFDTVWRSLFWAGTAGLVLFVLTAPDGFFALGRGRAVRKAMSAGTAAATTYTRLPESDTGEATLVSRVRGTWVVAEHDRGTWLPAGTRLDVQRGTLSCAPPTACDASFQAKGASRLTLRGSTPEDAREIEVLFASPTAMLWLVRPAGDQAARPSRVVLQAQGDGPASATAP